MDSMKANPCKTDQPSRKKIPLQHDLSYGDLIAEIGRLFLNKPYQAGTLEGPGREKLVINVSAFDCTTFVETVLALTQCAVSGKFSRNRFRSNLKLIRYRRGKIDGYSSRLHYFTDWLCDNGEKGIIADVTRRLGGKPQRKKINFMTAHRELYPALKNETELGRMSLTEKNLSRKVFYIIEKETVSEQKEKIKNGDIVAFTANREGLDVAHVGFALWQGKSLRLLHASSREGAVVISEKTLAGFLKANKTFKGIMVSRLI
jgi:hypothetical protein